jgi:tetratricopeptide (TPR) repeat protein
MNSSFKLGLVSFGIALSAFFFVFGSVLPVLKSQAYINSARNVNKTRTISEFKNNFDKVFNFYSPVGGEESAKYLMSNIITVVSGQKDMSESVLRELIAYIEPKMYPETRHYISMATLHTLALTRFKQQEDYDKAVGYYLKAREIGPKLPPVLYGLLTLYNATGDEKGVREVGGEILKHWPQDTRVSELLAEIEGPAVKK